MIVLVDTSVWVRFLSNRSPHAAELDGLLSRDEVSGHDFVYGELLIGDRSGRRQLLAAYEQMHHAPVVPHTSSAQRDERTVWPVLSRPLPIAATTPDTTMTPRMIAPIQTSARTT